MIIVSDNIQAKRFGRPKLSPDQIYEKKLHTRVAIQHTLMETTIFDLRKIYADDD